MALTWDLAPRHKIDAAKPRVTLSVAGKKINFLIGTGEETLREPSLLEFLGPLIPSPITIIGVEGKPHPMLQTSDLPCSLGDQISYSFLVLPNCPTPLLGRDLMTKLGTQLILQPQASFLGVLGDFPADAQPSHLPPETQIPSMLWDTDTPGGSLT